MEQSDTSNASPASNTHELEARALIESTGDYDGYEVDDVMDFYRRVVKHIGFKDNRRDERIVVKFHDVFYYAPDFTNEEDGAEDTYNAIFDDFCYDQYTLLDDNLKSEHNTSIQDLSSNIKCGHYSKFLVDIPEITQENATEIAMRLYDESVSIDYLDAHIYAVNWMQDLEDNYMDYWLDYLRGVEFPEHLIKQTEDKYHDSNEYKLKHNTTNTTNKETQ